ncbi:MAG: hypothetical protein GY801_07080 [bacterium]|nr:hypothetical protein [bacterium]
MSDETVIAVLVEALQGAEILVASPVSTSRLVTRGVVVTALQIERIFTRYGLEPEENGGLTLEAVAKLREKVRSVSQRCRRQILCATDIRRTANEEPGICSVYRRCCQKRVQHRCH